MENIEELDLQGGAPRCIKCNKLYKKTMANEHSLCPKCLSERVDAGAVNAAISNVGDGNGQPKNPIALLREDEESSIPADTGQLPGNESQVSEVQLAMVKPAQAIRDRFQQMNKDGKITPEVLSILTDTEATKRELGIRYAFLKEFNSNTSIKVLTYVGGHARYSSKPIEINGKQYITTNDLYKKNVKNFIEWSNLFY